MLKNARYRSVCCHKNRNYDRRLYYHQQHNLRNSDTLRALQCVRVFVFSKNRLVKQKTSIFQDRARAVDFESFEITRDFGPGYPLIFSRATRAEIRASRIG